MPVPQLPNELWVPILDFLRRPTPAPRSAPPRSNLRSPDLCSAARVSKLFAEICQPLLYRHIATDRLDLVLPKTAAELPSKLKLLGHTKSLFIEYRSKELHVSYERIFQKRGAWDAVGADQNTQDAYTRDICIAEIEDLARGLEVLDGWGPSRVSLPKLEILSLCSIYGGQDRAWMKYTYYLNHPLTKRKSPFPPSPNQAGLLYQKLCHTSSLRHLCSRAVHGPYSTPPSTFAPRGSEHEITTFSWTNHFSEDVVGLSIPYNRSIDWVSDCPSTMDWGQAGRAVSHLFRKTVEWREMGTIRGTRSDKVDIAMYCSAKFDESDLQPDEAHVLAGVDAVAIPPDLHESYDTKDRRRLYQMGKMYQNHFRRDSGLDVRFRWFPSDMASSCPACGSLPPP